MIFRGLFESPKTVVLNPWATVQLEWVPEIGQKYVTMYCS